MLRAIPAVALMFAGCCTAVHASEPPSAEALPAYADGDAYALYSTILKLDHPDVTLLLVGSTTASMDTCIEPNGALADKVAEANVESIEINQTARQLRDGFIPRGSVRLLAPAEISDLWRHHPGIDTSMVISFSAVGFSKDRTVAVLFEREQWNLRGGSGAARAFVRDIGGWKEIPNQTRCQVMY